MSNNFDNTRIIMAAANSARQREIALDESTEVARQLYLGYLRLHMLLFRTIHLDWNDVIDSVIFTRPGLQRLLDSLPREGTGPKLDICVPNLNLREAYCERLFDSSGRHVRKYFWSIIEKEDQRREATKVFAARKASTLTDPLEVARILKDYAEPGIADQSYHSLDYLNSFLGHDQVLIRKAPRRPSLDSDIMLILQARLQGHLRSKQERDYFAWLCNYISVTHSILRADVHNQYWSQRQEGQLARGLWRLTTLFDNRYYTELARIYHCVCAPEGITRGEFDAVNRERVLLGDYFSSTCPRLGIEVPRTLLLHIGSVPCSTFVEAYAKACKHIGEWWNLDRTARALSQVPPKNQQAAERALRRAVHEFLEHIGPGYDAGLPGELQRVDNFLRQSSLAPKLVGAGLGALALGGIQLLTRAGGAAVSSAGNSGVWPALGALTGLVATDVLTSVTAVGGESLVRLRSPWFNALANRIVRYAFRVRFPERRMNQPYDLAKMEGPREI